MNSRSSRAKAGSGRVWPASLWGYSRVHLRMNQATGLMSMAVHLAAQPHRFQGDGAAAGERVQHLGRASAVGLADLIAEPLEVGVVLAAPSGGCHPL